MHKPIISTGHLFPLAIRDIKTVFTEKKLLKGEVHDPVRRLRRVRGQGLHRRVRAHRRLRRIVRNKNLITKNIGGVKTFIESFVTAA